MRRLFLFTLAVIQKMQIFKYQGTGNDFVLIDERTISYNLTSEQIAFICARRFGIGADGFISLKNEDSYDFRMVYYNADGNEGTMCGNGGRCAVKFAHDLGIFETQTTFIAVDGEHKAELNNEGIVKLKMINANTGVQADENAFFQTGSPHVVIPVTNIKNFEVYTQGKEIRNNEYWTANGGANINFVEPIADSEIYVRTYERGVEDETYSCGTGVTAAALFSFENLGMNSPIAIKTLGGELSVTFTPVVGGYQDIYLSGPAKKVFEGEISL